MRRPLTTTLLIATTTTTLLATAAWADAPKPGLTLPKGKLSVARITEASQRRHRAKRAREARLASALGVEVEPEEPGSER
jgi:hypothetical protein